MRVADVAPLAVVRAADQPPAARAALRDAREGVDVRRRRPARRDARRRLGEVPRQPVHERELRHPPREVARPHLADVDPVPQQLLGPPDGPRPAPDPRLATLVAAGRSVRERRAQVVAGGVDAAGSTRDLERATHLLGVGVGGEGPVRVAVVAERRRPDVDAAVDGVPDRRLPRVLVAAPLEARHREPHGQGELPLRRHGVDVELGEADPAAHLLDPLDELERVAGLGAREAVDLRDDHALALAGPDALHDAVEHGAPELAARDVYLVRLPLHLDAVVPGVLLDARPLLVRRLEARTLPVPPLRHANVSVEHGSVPP